MQTSSLEYTGPFKDIIPGFVEFKRGLGYDYGYIDLYRLRELDIFFKNHGVVDVSITEEMFDLWSALRDEESATNQRRRQNKLIEFGKYLRTRGYHDIYIGELLCRVQRKKPNPHIFTKTEMGRVFTAARTKAAANPKNRDYQTFVVLLAFYYCCGCRKSEAQNLRVCDVDTDTGCIRIMDSKNHVSRLLVASTSLLALITEYKNAHCLDLDDADILFRSMRSSRFPDNRLYRIYHEVLADAGIQPRENGRLPRVHDLRHTFCVHTLEEMAKKGFDLYVALPLLVKYLGHKCITETEYYLRLVEENFTSVVNKSRAYAPNLFPEIGVGDGKE